MNPFGLGDLAHYAFRPLVYFVDFCWGTDLKHCSVCKARRKRWNAIASVRGWVAACLVVTGLGVMVVWITR